GMYTASAGPCMFIYDGSTLEKIKNLTAVAIDSLNQSYAKAKSITYSLSDNVAVYVKNDSGYFSSNVSAVSNTSSYDLTAYYDKSEQSGGRIRVIIAIAK
ncbi:MAG: S-layer homology domain-containing protein, partial [Clostridiales bacterium]|nr:S-layer homology domain-containing protein [Clostridiales bacterium]